MLQSVMTSNNHVNKSTILYQRYKVCRYMNTDEVVCIVVIIFSSIWGQVVKENVQILSQCGIGVPSLLHLICTMLTDMGGNWGFEGQCHGNSIRICQYSLSRFDGFYQSRAPFGESTSNLHAFLNVDWRFVQHNRR